MSTLHTPRPSWHLEDMVHSKLYLHGELIQVPKSWKHFHPVFHNSLISPHNETPAHGPNFTRPPPEIVQGEDDHYEVESVLQSRLTPNKKVVQYHIKWKGYPSSENSWLPASQMKSVSALVQQFHSRNPNAPRPVGLRFLTAQQPHKEGILSQTKVEVRNGPIQNHLVTWETSTGHVPLVSLLA